MDTTLSSSGNSSLEMLQSTLDKTMVRWRADLEQALPAFVWETIARERSRSETSEKDENIWTGLADLGEVLYFQCHIPDVSSWQPFDSDFTHAKATADSYERYFPYEPFSSISDLLEYLETFPSSPTNSLHLVISDEERRNIIGVWSASLYSSLTETDSNGITDQYTGKQVFLHQMSTTKIRKDLYFMWKSQLYSDMQIVVPSSINRNDDDEGRIVGVFSCHRSILAARSPYFREILLRPDIPGLVHRRPDDLFIIPLPSPPFNPVTVDFTLLFLYTGALQFPHSQFISDYSTTMALYRAALFLQVPSLKDLIVAHIVSDILHGSFSAGLTPSEYYQLTEGRWRNMGHLGGCSCRQCSRRAPRILAFSLEPDIHDPLLERGTRRALVGMFGPGWCTQELGSLPEDILDSVLASLKEIITPRNALLLLFAAEEALVQLGDVPAYWHRPIRRLIMSARAFIDDIICQQSRPCFYCEEWRELITVREETFKFRQKDYEDEMKMAWILGALSRAVRLQNASSVYETLTWFTDAQVPPEKQNQRIIEMMAALKEELFRTSMQSKRASVISSDSSIFEPIDPNHQSVVTVDPSDNSVYSYPSSRTMSTEYGIYYTRMAISQETVETVPLERGAVGIHY